MNIQEPKNAFDRDYIPIADHGLIGNLHTAALVSTDGSIESYCIPHFDSPSVFARILDKNKGGHFSISPTVPFTTKQNYYPSSNVLQTKFMNESGVASVTGELSSPESTKTQALCRSALLGTSFPAKLPPRSPRNPSFHGLSVASRRVIRGKVPLRMECAPAFNYARSKHTTVITPSSAPANTLKADFHSDSLALDLRYVPENTMASVPCPKVGLELLDLSSKGHLGLAVQSEMLLVEGQCVTFILRSPPNGAESGASQYEDPVLTKELVHGLLTSTNKYWNDWIRQSTYSGSWKEAVHRSALALKLLIFEPTGAVVASPTFSLPEFIGGTRNWDYRASWIRDSSFTLYALIRLGFTQEADAYMEFIFERLRNKNPDGSLQIMYTIHGGKDLEELELSHLDGHKGSRPVRIGNGAADHLQLDIYGELMDCIYLGQKFGRPLVVADLRNDTRLLVRGVVDYVVANCHLPDLSIWEVRNKKRHFTAIFQGHALVFVPCDHALCSDKMNTRVAIDRGLRIADKRSLPCPNRPKWLETRDRLYEEIMEKAWHPELQVFGQSYEETDVMDSAVLIMPLVFFIQPSDPRFVSTLRQILNTPERGGLTSNNLVFRYDVTKSDDGVGGEEGTFCLCTLWCVEALTRAGEYDRPMLLKAVSMFEDFLLYLNHVGLCTEEISDAGEGLGNAVQGFTHVTLISAAYNLSRTMQRLRL
ncbi:Glycoside hydrolase family 15 protein [Mycena indigotica]|uniref:Glycoside hydrolase family 15 protein n=1 Tax=Mycena indigotica TaxID=2126181 RepID=A0A8H6SQI2_9AGAR|nr:Glycoside hydrolase family 15 protein [Mycena indigotica]KAF7303574.1 Glycoside hydrolase family 15 protein [Mycena indigotica]